MEKLVIVGGTILLTLLANYLFDDKILNGAYKVKNDKARWFLLHAWFNAAVVVMVLPEALNCLINPLTPSAHDDFREGLTSLVSTAAIGAFHIYHALRYSLTTEDVIHHSVNAGIVVVLAVLIPWGNMVDLSNLAMCGLPGGIDYAMLYLVKVGSMDRMTEKRYNRFLNIGIRWPIMYIVSYIMFLRLYYHYYHLSFSFILISVLSLIVHGGNALYYADRVVGNYHVEREREKLQQQNVNI